MSQKIKVSVDEALRLFLFLEDLNHFFHSPSKYHDPVAVVEYVEGGMYDRLREMYYHIIPSWLPENVLRDLEDRPPPAEIIKRLRQGKNSAEPDQNK